MQNNRVQIGVIMEQRIHDLIDGYSEILTETNEKYKCSVKLKKTDSGDFFVRIKIHRRRDSKLMLWTVIQVDSNDALIKVEDYLKYMEESFLNKYKDNWM